MAHLLSKEAGADCCVARLGGEEFAILQFDQTDINSFDFAEHLRKTIENSPLTAGEISVNLTVSIGFCDVDSNSTLNLALHQADKALYNAKRSGRNRVIKFDAAAPALAPESSDLIQAGPKMEFNHPASSN